MQKHALCYCFILPIHAIMTSMSRNEGLDSGGLSFVAGFAKKYPLFARVAPLLVGLEGAFVAFLGISRPIQANQLGSDAHAYWLAGQGNPIYDKAPGQMDAYLYSPAFTAIVQPFAMLPWPLFLTLWICIQSAVLVWLLKPLKAKWSIPIFLLCVPELVNGNIYILLAASAVMGLRKPALWAFPILTKITVGVGLLWFIVRGEWRHAFQGVGILAAIVGLSYIMAPDQWHAWLDFLFDHSDGTRDGSISFLVRSVLAVALIVIGARKQWPWVVAPAMVLASPALALTTLTMLTAIPRLATRVDPGARAISNSTTPRSTRR